MTNTIGWLDANVILRYLLNDHPQHAAQAKALIQAAEAQKLQLKVTPHIICEVIYVLQGLGYEKPVIYEAVRDFSGICGIQILEKNTVLKALSDFKNSNVDFADALLAALASEKGEIVWTFNAKYFKRIDCRWQTPN